MRRPLPLGTHGFKLRKRASYQLRSRAVWAILEELEQWRAAAKTAQRALYRRA